jgi:hypothetical protein
MGVYTDMSAIACPLYGRFRRSRPVGFQGFAWYFNFSGIPGHPININVGDRSGAGDRLAWFSEFQHAEHQNRKTSRFRLATPKATTVAHAFWGAGWKGLLVWDDPALNSLSGNIMWDYKAFEA